MAEKKRRGFAAMDPARQRELASRGGKKAHALGRAHRFTKEEASAAGKKGRAKVGASGNLDVFRNADRAKGAEARECRKAGADPEVVAQLRELLD